MKVLISTMPYPGHFNPTQPIVVELVKRGHEVVWLTGRDYEDKVIATGARFEEMAGAAVVVHEDTLPDPNLKGLAMVISLMRKLAINRIPAQVKDYQRVLDKFPADILLVEWCSWGAQTLRELTGQPYVTLGINPLVTRDPEIPLWGMGTQPPRTFLGRWMNSIMHWLATWLVYSKLDGFINLERKKLGLGSLPPGVDFSNGHFSRLAHIMMTTPAMEFPRKDLKPYVKFVGPLLPAVDETAFVPPLWWDEMLTHQKEKVIHVTQGTMVLQGDNLTVPSVRALASRKDLLVVVTGKNLDEIFTKDSPAPSNVRTAPFIPHVLLLPHVGVMVTNAGYNGVLTALGCGVPLVCAGTTEDKADVSSRVAWCGAGIDLRTDKPRGQDVLAAVVKITEDGKYREAAKRIMEDFATHDGPSEAADIMESVVAETQKKAK